MARWPLTPRPYDDELLSSFLARTALAHYTDTKSLFAKYWPQRSYYRRDIDVFEYTHYFWEKLSDMTALSLSRLHEMRLIGYEGYIQETIEPTGRQHWIVPLGHMAPKGNFMTIRFCPECLQEEGYFKKEWRLIFCNVCTKHKAYLHCRCQECGKGVNLRQICAIQTITQCLCGFDYRVARRMEVVDGGEIAALHYLKQITDQGFFIQNNKWEYSTGLFFILRILVARLVRLNKERVKYIEELEPHQLSPHIAKAVWLLDEWPDRFIQFCKDNKLTHRQAILDKYRYTLNDVPKWFLDGMDQVIEVQIVKSDEEMKAMFLWLKKNGKLTLREISEVSGWGIQYACIMKGKFNLS